MTDAITLPPNQVAFVDSQGRLTLAGRMALERFMREILSQVNAATSTLAAITELGDSAASLLASKADKSLLVLGSGSIDGGATTNLSANRTFQLVNDQATLPPHYAYGTDSDGNKGWQPLYASLQDYADDTAAAAGGVAIGSPYRTGSTLKVRIA